MADENGLPIRLGIANGSSLLPEASTDRKHEDVDSRERESPLGRKPKHKPDTVYMNVDGNSYVRQDLNRGGQPMTDIPIEQLKNQGGAECCASPSKQ